LRAAGIRTFLVTNSKTDYATLLLNYSFGEDWRSVFDIVIMNARKPLFFYAKMPFKLVDMQALKELPFKKANLKEMNCQDVYCEGNWIDLQNVFMRLDEQNGIKKSGVPAYPRVIYFGDRKYFLCLVFSINHS
jgi:hypothetical protein